MNTVRAHVRIRGSVQGVCYRLETQREAEIQGVAGWVKNKPDGSVEAVFEGTKEGVRHMIRWCEKGPPYSMVAEVDSRWEAPRGETGFRITY